MPINNFPLLGAKQTGLKGDIVPRLTVSLWVTVKGNLWVTFLGPYRSGSQSGLSL